MDRFRFADNPETGQLARRWPNIGSLTMSAGSVTQNTRLLYQEKAASMRRRHRIRSGFELTSEFMWPAHSAVKGNGSVRGFLHHLFHRGRAALEVRVSGVHRLDR